MPTELEQENMKKHIGNRTLDLLSFTKSRQNLIAEYINAIEKENVEDAFFIGDIGDVIYKYYRWMAAFPRITPFYAIKCNDDFAVLKVLADLGTGFDCASKIEIEKILKLGIHPSRIIYANPCKQISFIRHAAKNNVNLMTFDNETELHKVKSVYPNAKLVLRILPPNSFKVQCELGMKFGCSPKKAQRLLEVAKSLDLNVVGVSFHVGSGCQDAKAFEVAISDAKEVFDVGRKLGFNFNLLDIGGGFPGHDNGSISFEEIVQVVNETLEKHFPEESQVRIIAEPGRYFVASAFTLAVNVIAKRAIVRDQPANDSSVSYPDANEEPMYMYYVNDGVYGSFNCLLYDHATVTPCVLQESEAELMFSSSIWGPTCDGLDCILEDCQLPFLQVGDWIYFEDMGAYTMCAASTFNGMPKPKCYYYCKLDVWQEISYKTQKGERMLHQVPHIKVLSAHDPLDKVHAVKDVAADNLSIPEV